MMLRSEGRIHELNQLRQQLMSMNAVTDCGDIKGDVRNPVQT